MPRKQVERTCLGCGVSFFVVPSWVKRGWGKFHDRACFDAHKLKPQEGRVCTVCKQYKVAAEFRPNPQQPQRLRPDCKPCQNERMRLYNIRTRADRRARRILRQFGLTPEQYAALLEAQDGRCAICQTDEPGNGFEFMPVDHDHTTGAVRGLLCAACNHGLGSFKDNPALLRAAITYLEVANVSAGSDLRGHAGQGVAASAHPGEPPRSPRSRTARRAPDSLEL